MMQYFTITKSKFAQVVLNFYCYILLLLIKFITSDLDTINVQYFNLKLLYSTAHINLNLCQEVYSKWTKRTRQQWISQTNAERQAKTDSNEESSVSCSYRSQRLIVLPILVSALLL